MVFRVPAAVAVLMGREGVPAVGDGVRAGERTAGGRAAVRRLPALLARLAPLRWPVVGLALAVFLSLGWFARPQTDDYCVASEAAIHGLWGAQVFWYQNWMGRYTAAGALALLTEWLGLPAAARAGPFLLLLLLGSAGAWLARNLLPLRGRPLFGLLGMALAVYLAMLPNPEQVIYWFTGAYTYGLGLALGLALAGTLVWCPAGPRGRALRSGAAALLAAAATGCNETLMVALMLGAPLWWLWRRRRGRAGDGWLVGVVWAAAAAVILAPGNAVREAAFPEGGQFWGALAGTLTSTAGYGLKWTASLPLWGASLLALAVFGPWRGLGGRWGPWLGIALVAAGFFPAHWAMGHRPPGRALAVIHLVFLFAWFAFWLPRLAARLAWDWRAWRRPAMGLVVLGMLVQGNLPFALYDLASGRAQAYGALQDQRHAVMQNADPEATRVVPALADPPATLFHEDITGDPADWRNRCVARYYGVAGVRTPTVAGGVGDRL